MSVRLDQVTLQGPGQFAETSAPETTVLIVDDHRCFADLLSAALGAVPGIRCVGTAATAAEGIQRVAELSPSVVVMDIQMPGTDGLVATRRLREASPNTAVAVVTAHADGEWMARAAQAGASAFIPKGGSLAEMITMLQAAKPGRMSVAPSVLSRGRTSAVVGGEPRQPLAPRDELTQREQEVLGYIGQGLQAKSIARVMGISIHTCRGYIKTVYAKLQVSSRIEAVNRGRQLQLISS
jgi:DNA-binding NarL/FixJ family response regulator